MVCLVLSERKRHCKEAEVPDFKQMNPCAVSLVDKTARREYVKRALAVVRERAFGVAFVKG